MIYAANNQICFYLRLPKVNQNLFWTSRSLKACCIKKKWQIQKKIILPGISSRTVFWMVSQLLRLDSFCSIYSLCCRRWKHPKILIVQLCRWKEILGDQTGRANTCVSWRLEQEFGLWKPFRRCFPFRFINLVPCFWSDFKDLIIILQVLQREKPGLCPDPLPPLAATTQTREDYENIEWKKLKRWEKFKTI